MTGRPPPVAARGAAAEGRPARKGPRRRSTIRMRLTVFYGIVFALCGLALTLVGYLMVRGSLLHDEGTSDQRVIETYGYSRPQVQLFYDLPVPAPSTGRTASNVGDVIVGVQQDIRDDALHQLLVGSGAALGVMVAASLVVGWWAAGRALRPVGRITARAQRLSEDNLHERLRFDGPPDELKELADTLDGMLERLDRSFTAQRSFAANVSHELRTPLAVLQAEADLVLDHTDATDRERRFAQAVHDQAARSEALLDALLTLARSDSTMADRHRVDLADIAGEVVADHVEAADRAGIRIDLELEAAWVDGDPWLLERLVTNLVDNAVKYSQAGGWMRVGVRRIGDRAVLEAANTGERLSDDRLDELLQPFRRGQPSAGPGFGLGMAIVASVVQAHGGTFTVTARSEGGLEVVVSLPAAGGGGPRREPAPPGEPAATGELGGGVPARARSESPSVPVEAATAPRR